MYTKIYINEFVSQASQEAKRDLQHHLEEELSEGRPIKDIVADVRDIALKNCIPEQDVITLVSILNAMI